MTIIGGKIWDVHVLLSVLMIAFALGYLLFLLIASRISPRRARAYRAAREGEFDVVYVIPCLNEAVVIKRSVERLLEAHPGAHILVVNDGSDDDTGDIVTAMDDDHVHVLTRVLPEARQGKGEALNAAYRHILTGHVVDVSDPSRVLMAIVDADGRLEDGVADHVLPAFAGNPTMGAVQIGVRIVNRETSVLARMQDVEFALYTELYQRGRRHLGDVNLGGNGQFVRLSALQDLKPHPWSTSLTEDLDLGVRLMISGWGTDYIPTTAVHQQGLVSMRRWVRQRTRWFQGYLQAWALLPSVLRRLPLHTRADLLFHLTSPFVTLMGSVYGLAFIIGGVNLLDDWLYGRYAPQTWWLVMYALMFVPSMLFGLLIYRPMNKGLGVFKLLFLMHVYPLYSQLWFLAGWQGVVKLLRGKTTWAKTERIVETIPAQASLT